jgi:signal transduction histidine kinase
MIHPFAGTACGLSEENDMIKILVIDDDAATRGEVESWLDVEGFEVLTADDGMVGIKYAYDYVPQLIICDISVPQLDGYGVLLEVRANPATANTPVIFLSASKPEEQLRPRLPFNADDFITKPFTQDEFLQRVQARLQKKSLEEQALQHRVVQLEQALALEQEQRLLKAKLVAMVAHDFRNPLASILSSNNLLRDYADRMDENRRLVHMNRIDASVQHLLSMLDEMLVLAELDCGILVFTPEMLNVGFLFEQIVEEFQLINIDSHQVVFENHFTAPMMADPRLLKQIATNLISNAIKYSYTKGVVHVTLEENNEQIILKVHDQGIGISEADQHSLFDAFQRGSNVGSIPGTGLGLTIVKRAVDLYQGQVQIESEIGHGTTMIVLLPISPVLAMSKVPA